MPKKNLKSAISALFRAFLAVGLLVGLTSCNATGSDAPTRNVKQVTDGVEAISGDIKAVNVLLVAQEDGSAVLVGTLLNQGKTSDSITGITANGIAGEITSVLLEENAPIIFAGDSANATGKFVGLNVKASDRVVVEITFANAAPINLNAIVRAKADIYANVGN